MQDLVREAIVKHNPYPFRIMAARVEEVCSFVTDLEKRTHWDTAWAKMDNVSEVWSKIHVLQTSFFRYKAGVT